MIKKFFTEISHFQRRSLSSNSFFRAVQVACKDPGSERLICPLLSATVSILSEKGPHTTFLSSFLPIRILCLVWKFYSCFLRLLEPTVYVECWEGGYKAVKANPKGSLKREQLDVFHWLLLHCIISLHRLLLNALLYWLFFHKVSPHWPLTWSPQHTLLSKVESYGFNGCTVHCWVCCVVTSRVVGQRLNVQMEISEMWCPSRVCPYWDQSCLISTSVTETMRWH